MQDFLLTEDGYRLLQENGDKIFLEQQGSRDFSLPGMSSVNTSS